MRFRWCIDADLDLGYGDCSVWPGILLISTSYKTVKHQTGWLAVRAKMLASKVV
jgi:hypothetical protein